MIRGIDPMSWRALKRIVFLLAANFLATEVLLAEPVAFRATTLEGRQLQGSLIAATPESITLRADDQMIPLTVRELSRLETLAPSQEKSLIRQRVELADGSAMPVLACMSDGVEFQLGVPAELTTEAKISLPYSAVRSVTFSDDAKESASLQRQWEELGKLEHAGDLIVVYRNQRSRLDSVEAVVESIGPERVRLTLENESIEVDRRKLYGIVFFRAREARVAADKGIRVETRQGANLVGELAGLTPDGRLALRSALGPLWEVELEEIQGVDLTPGRVVYLSDLSPTLLRWTPFFPIDGALELARSWGEPRRDQSFHATSLVIVDGDQPPQVFAKGLAVRSHTELEYEIPKGFAWFRCVAGIDPVVRTTGDVELLLYGDGKLLDRKTVAGPETLQIALPIESVVRFRLVVDYGVGADVGDNLHLGSARFTK